MQSAGEIVVERFPKRGCESEDTRLVQAVLAGEPSAFDVLVERHMGRVASVARRFVDDPNDLEDVVQETFLRAYQKLHRYRGDAALRTWLIQIAINVCRDRRGGFWRRKVVLAEDPALLESTEDPAETSDRSMLRRAIEQAVRRLPEKLRLPFVLHAFEDLSGVEIAAALGWNQSTVWSRIYAARKQLRELLGDLVEG
jgi:RNA polymerase sigma-70 factor (ECF subfamily)